MPFANTESLILNEGRCVGLCGFSTRFFVRRARFWRKAGDSLHGRRGTALSAHDESERRNGRRNGDGIFRSVQKWADMEFVQFHPTALSLENAPRFLLSEAMRGEGGILRNKFG
ncbi:L-aspartate oxidase [Biomphalaria pfeifferi]|uniref:L-aspartate oxidase n=1 Tax=Biomphalaria pfeifferi TaxID=112525 RepID=A0AAD8AP13_BIOPF|nr:L-aspartate oxidase [Biomphalaria pfeifferi]